MESAEHWEPENPARLGSRFVLGGRLGFWIQLVLLIIALTLAVYVYFAGGVRAGRLGIGNLLAFSVLALPVFTTFWVRRYIGVGAKIPDLRLRPSMQRVLRMLWIGIWAGAVGVVLSLVSLFGAVSNFLYVLLTLPKTGVMVTAAAGQTDVGSISAIDAVSLIALLILLTAELMVISLSLWLVFKTRFSDQEG